MRNIIAFILRNLEVLMFLINLNLYFVHIFESSMLFKCFLVKNIYYLMLQNIFITVGITYFGNKRLLFSSKLLKTKDAIIRL